MKTKLKVLLLILISTILTAQEFPVGVYIHTTADKRPSTNYNEVKAMGVNWVFERADDFTKSNLDSIFVIAANADSPADVIHHYSGAYYSKWEAEEGGGLALNHSQPGIRHEAGLDIGNYWRVENDIAVGKKIICGPYYLQARKYNLGYKQNQITYNVNFNMRLAGNVNSGTPICRLYVNYTVLDKDASGNYIQITSDPLDEKILYAEKISSSFTNHQLSYSVPEKIGGIQTKMDYPNIDVIDPTQYPPYGVQFIIEWLDDEHEGVLDIDYIEVYDEDIWGDYKDRMSIVDSLIISYANKSIYQTWDEIQYWAGVDEPSYIDQYEPYRIVNSLLKNNGKPGLISAVYPNFDGKRNWEIATERFLDIVEPDQLLYDYYPYWSDKPNDQGLRTQQLTIQRMFKDTDEHTGYFNNCFFLAQAHAFWRWDDENNVPIHFKKWPNRSMLRANVMLALAHGAKGVFFWNYFSYTNPDHSYRCLGIVDSNNVKSELYYEIKDSLAPRLKGELGEALLDIDYTTYFDYEKINVIYDSGITDDSEDNIDFVDILNTSQNTDTLNFHIGLLEDSLDVNRKYLMIGNMNCAVPTKSTDLMLNVSNPLSKYSNYTFRNIESQFNYNKTINLSGSSTFTDTITFSSGDGHLYELKPVLKYGGNLVYDDTVNTAISLNDEITIKPNADLVVEALYNIASDIYVEDGGTIKTQHPGGITFSNEAKFNFEDWSDCLVVSQNSGHPKLHWNEYVGESQEIRYEIYRKKNTSSFELIHTISDKSATEYIDTGVQIIFSQQANMTTAEYYIKLYELPSKNWVQTDQTNIAIVNQVQGIAPDKKGAEGNEIIKPHTFALEQNHPNLFNPTTVINYQIPELSHVTIKVYDILGKEIAEFVDTKKDAGFYSVNFDASNLSSGTYIYRMEAGKFVESNKMIILK